MRACLVAASAAGWLALRARVLFCWCGAVRVLAACLPPCLGAVALRSVPFALPWAVLASAGSRCLAWCRVARGLLWCLSVGFVSSVLSCLLASLLSRCSAGALVLCPGPVPGSACLLLLAPAFGRGWLLRCLGLLRCVVVSLPAGRFALPAYRPRGGPLPGAADWTGLGRATKASRDALLAPSAWGYF